MIHDTNIMLEVDGILQNTVAGFFMELMYSFCDLDIVMLLILLYFCCQTGKYNLPKVHFHEIQNSFIRKNKHKK